MIKHDRFPVISARLSMNDFTNLLFACSHLDHLDKQYEWPILLEVFSQKIQAQFSIQHVIKCMLSLTLAKVGTAEEFWQPLLELIIIQLQKPNGTKSLNDLLIVTNLLYLLSEQKEMLNHDQIRTIVGILLKDCNLLKLLKNNAAVKTSNNVSHLVYSCAKLEIQDD